MTKRKIVEQNTLTLATSKKLNSNNRKAQYHAGQHHLQQTTLQSFVPPASMNLVSSTRYNGATQHSVAAGSASMSTASSAAPMYKIYCDLDGVLCDFEAGVERIFRGKRSTDLPVGTMWSGISKCNDFYGSLPWTVDGKKLWDVIRHLQPDILTGVPMNKSTRKQKAKWCRRELFGVTTNHVDMAGPKRSHELVSGRKKNGVVNVITCWSKNKHFESREMAYLIDDRLDLSHQWVESGGVFIHHTSSDHTLSQLREHGLMPADKIQETDEAILDGAG